MNRKSFQLTLSFLGLSAVLIACSVSPPPRSETSAQTSGDSGKTNPSNNSIATQNGGLNCSLTASATSVVFGSGVSLSLTASEKPTALSIEGNLLDPNINSIRYTPPMGGENNVTAIIGVNDRQATCSTTITATAPIIPQSAGCDPTYQTRTVSNMGVWLGADVGHAFNLSSNRTLSLYGDTYIGPLGLVNRFGSQMVGNTIGISSCQNGTFTTTLHWGGLPGAPKPFFQNSDGSFDRYWSTNLPWKTGKNLYIPLSAIQNTKSGVGFQSLRTDIAIISNPDDPPGNWKISYKPFFNISSFTSPTSQGSSNFWGGIYNVPYGDFIYFYNNSGNDLTISRISSESLTKDPENPSSLLQYLSKDGTWKSGYVDADAKRLGIPANTSLSVRYNFKLKKWLMIHFDTSSWISPKIYLRKSDRIEGPWSDKIAIYDVPEVTAGKPAYDKRNFCYQAFEHLEFNSDPDNKLAMTYSCNANDMTYVSGNMNIYFPKFLKLPIPQ